MRTELRFQQLTARQQGVSLVELIVFVVVISVALAGLLGVYQIAVVNSADPLKRLRMLEYAQERLDQIMALRYDEATPAGGVPACDSGLANAQACTNSADGDMDDVDDFHEQTDNPAPDSNFYSRVVSVEQVVFEGESAKLITVTISANDGESLTLSAYRVNF